MDTYKIKLTIKAKNDYKKIIYYIKFKWTENCRKVCYINKR